MPVLQLDFRTFDGKSRRLSIRDADTTKTGAEILEAMESIIDSGANENFDEVNRARFVQTDITDVELPIEE